MFKASRQVSLINLALVLDKHYKDQHFVHLTHYTVLHKTFFEEIKPPPI